ncbi:MAG: YitT family protein [Anaeromicrobium sp.]|jgi:uncharacterized membrane-anchored protein YitT (DUF2179 family)|uniref:YitT family protein n=1 Tax=Anaeromicrobium sp. TaxID=1929132 RepID=UPI0025EB7EE8|nr:YitT family protein [Anaeromicrobium sp.]MCT4594472.1 YitT family protein [Anaeromicrobium sp.]
MKKSKKTTIIEEVSFVVGIFIIAFGLIFFLKPHTIAPGGISGFAVVIDKLFNIPMDVTNIVVNIPLFLVGIRILGKKFTLRSFAGTLILSFFIRLIISVLGENIIMVDDVLLSALYGGVLMGVGLGLVFKSGGSTGGTDLAGAILNKYFPHISIPKLMMIFDFFIVVSSGIVGGKLENSLYSLISLYIIVKVADFIVEGLNYAKAFYIISDKSEEIGKNIVDNLGRGATILKGVGVYTGAEKNVIMCIVDTRQITKLKNIVNHIDSNAFVMVTTVHEVLGEGFKINN